MKISHLRTLFFALLSLSALAYMIHTYKSTPIRKANGCLYYTYRTPTGAVIQDHAQECLCTTKFEVKSFELTK